ncbi:TPA: hypothetical protein L6B52_09555 [Pseudomonas aeruginosa]|nr:hypothetical protein [Pseudomonas aeruginosa]
MECKFLAHTLQQMADLVGVTSLSLINHMLYGDTVSHKLEFNQTVVGKLPIASSTPCHDDVSARANDFYDAFNYGQRLFNCNLLVVVEYVEAESKFRRLSAVKVTKKGLLALFVCTIYRIEQDVTAI